MIRLPRRSGMLLLLLLASAITACTPDDSAARQSGACYGYRPPLA